ncbi:MAG: TIGR03960 family B12-binding radical SAM protein [Chitinophagales bacterium]
MKDILLGILPEVTRPARYTGNELNAIVKDWEKAKTRMAFAFPDVYEIGMSHLGGRILYGLINETTEFLMERTFAPWPDMEAKMRENCIPLFSLESFRPVKEFDVLGFSLQYELSYSNVLNMLDLAGMPVYARDRDESYPLVIAGGPNTFNPEPMADFIDVFVIGDGEEVLPEILKQVADLRGQKKKILLKSLVNLPGVYVPSFYEVTYRDDGTVLKRLAKEKEAPDTIQRAVVKNLDRVYFPGCPVVPYLGIVHDRAVLEIMRGCQRGCRFCQAGIIYRPVRERDPETLKKQAQKMVESTGYDEISLASLSSADYSGIKPLIENLVDVYGQQGVGVALPSLRADAFSVDLANQVQRVRKTTLTFAPEAGTQRLRDVINKNVNEEDILVACRAAFSAGWLGVKLYFMLGLPTETDEDLDGIIVLLRKIKKEGSEHSRRPIKINASLSFFVPKPHTSFQWEPQVSIEEMERKKQYLLHNGRIKNVSYDFHDPRTSFLEAVIARGDRRLASALHLAWSRGARFDGWREYFDFSRYIQALADSGLNPVFYSNRKRSFNEVLPWNFVDTGLFPEFLREEYDKAIIAETTADCRENGCQQCGICPNLEIEMDLKETDYAG